jgi:hypothetical protein
LLSINQQEEQNRMTIFMYALKAAESRRQYLRRFKIFLDYLKLDRRTIREVRSTILIKSKKRSGWAEENFMRFIGFQMKKAKRGYIYMLVDTIEISILPICKLQLCYPA